MIIPDFATPLWLAGGLLAALLLVLLFLLAEKRAWQRLHIFASPGLLERLTGSHSRQRLWIKNSLLILGVFLLFMTLSRPQWGADWESAETIGMDVMIALDTSRSMLAEDINPNRLERSKLAVLDLLETIRGDRVGLIAFAGRAFLQSPLTLDYQAFQQTLAAIDTDTIPLGGTDIAAAIDEAEAYFEKTGNERILILITDGEDLEASGLQRAREAGNNGTRILTVGVGSTRGELIPITNARGERDFLRDDSGTPVSTALDESMLRRIAEVTNGLYAPMGPTGDGLLRAYEFILTQGSGQEQRELLQRRPIERFQWPLLAAIFLLLAESLLTTRRRPLPGKSAPGSLTALLFIGILLSPDALSASSAREAAKAYREGRFEESVQHYREALLKNPDEAKLLFNLGVSAYRAGSYEEAIIQFEKGLRVGDPGIQQKAFYNLGNSRVAHGFDLLEEQPQLTRDLWQAALTDFTNALALDSNHEGATLNREVLEATLQAYTHTLETRADPPEGGSVTPTGDWFHRLPIPIKAEASDGWQFTKWTGEGITDPERAQTVIRIEEDQSITAHFVKTWRLEVINANPDRGTAGKSGVYRADEPVTITAEAKDYFAFSKWISDTCTVNDSTAAETEVTLTQDASVTAHFVPAFKLSVMLDPEIGGQAGPSGFFEEFSTVPIQANPRPGFEWVGWLGDGIQEPTEQETSIALTADRIAIAKMERIWNLVIIPTPEEGGQVTGAGDHPVGSTVDISATPAEGFSFLGWEGPGVEDPAAPETRVTVLSEEHTLYARFEQEDQEDQDQEDQDQEQQQDQEDEQEQEEPSEEEQPQEEEPQEEQETEPEQPEDQEPEANPSEPDTPQPDESLQEPVGQLTPEEAQQLLNSLLENEGFLPAGERSRDRLNAQDPPSGKDW